MGFGVGMEQPRPAAKQAEGAQEDLLHEGWATVHCLWIVTLGTYLSFLRPSGLRSRPRPTARARAQSSDMSIDCSFK